VQHKIHSSNSGRDVNQFLAEEASVRTSPPRRFTSAPLISVVSKGEIYSLAKQFGWGDGKLKTLDELLRKLPTVDISHDK
jgi:hypothetical protein